MATIRGRDNFGTFTKAQSFYTAEKARAFYNSII